MASKRIAIVTATAALVLGIAYLSFNHFYEPPLRKGLDAVKAEDYDLALKILLPLAIAGDSDAREEVGFLYAFGLGVEADPIRAEAWYRRGECDCISPGQGEYSLGLEFATQYRLHDPDAAIHWLSLAAEAGNIPARRLLANPSELKSKGLSLETAQVEYWRKLLEEEAELEKLE